MEIDEKLKSKLEKLKELAERGVGGERTNAQLLMQRLADEYGIVLDDLFYKENIEEYHQLYNVGKSKDYKSILLQTAHRVINKSSIYCYREGQCKVYIKATKLQHLEIDRRLNKYLSDFKKEEEKAKKALIYAFLDKNELLGDYDPDRPSKKLTAEELEVMLMAAGLKDSINKTSVHLELDSVKQ